MRCEGSPSPAGCSSHEAKRTLARLLVQVDEQRNAKTRVTLGVAMDERLKIHDVEANTRKGTRHTSGATSARHS